MAFCECNFDQRLKLSSAKLGFAFTKINILTQNECLVLTLVINTHHCFIDQIIYYPVVNISQPLIFR